ncbi:hypothetical protein DSO57_1000599 [Entomophthora muscae]|uniref:Uncharacterized protein n=1 Tax=Entomophthora muscae TaxID=34485 RepID=A0ACC2S037_9FUNG|nr:hypothetical protein DSO57_1000599 [Entomophthora muscae]
MLALFWLAAILGFVQCQAGSDRPVDEDEMDRRREEVRGAFLHAWEGYENIAFGSDEVRPLSNATVNDRFQGWGATMVDSLSTLWIMDFKSEFYRCVERISTVDFSRSNGQVLFFETVIRYLGGLISGYDLSGEPVLLEKAIQLADRLLPAFNSPSGFPYYRIDFASNKPDTNGGRVILSEIGTVQMEFTRLSIITNDPKYKEAALKVYDKLNLMQKPMRGLYPVFLNVNTGLFLTNEITFGALGDSFYEYLLKMYIMLGPNSDRHKYLAMFKESVDGLKSLIRRGYGDRLYVGQIDPSGQYRQTMDHLAFFIPGMLSLGSHVTGSSDYQSLALELVESCYHAYEITSTGLGPEVIGFGASRDITVRAPSNNLRPELLESLFYAYQSTGDSKYPDRAYQIFQSMQRYSRTPTAFAGYRDVNNPDVSRNQLDVMESFFMAETMKYLYLLFCPQDYWDLDTWVFNTEAHPFRISK